MLLIVELFEFAQHRKFVMIFSPFDNFKFLKDFFEFFSNFGAFLRWWEMEICLLYWKLQITKPFLFVIEVPQMSEICIIHWFQI